jgi:gamma-glutamyltranspeptidase/glutathione hydrolase
MTSSVPEVEARRFPRACVASPHYLASAAGLAVLAAGGNAMDAAVAANLVLGVVMPRSCGYGGDLFALVWRDGLHAYNGSGRAPADATPERVRAAAGSPAMPERGPLPVTVPGAVEAWFALLGRFGTRSFEELAAPALRLAREGFPLTGFGASLIGETRRAFGASPVFEEWRRVYGEATSGRRLAQPALARTIEALARQGPAAYYRGAIAEAIGAEVGRLGGLLSAADLATHHGDWITPLSTSYRGLEIVELPPNTQGVAVLEALNLVEGSGPLPSDPVDREHLLIEAMKLALQDRDAFVTDPAAMRVDPAALASKAWAAGRWPLIDMKRARPLHGPRVPSGGTVALCAADASGMCVSLIQSNFFAFGSGVTVPGWGITLQNRGASFALDPGHANVIGPRKRTLHTLIPGLALRDGRPWLVFGTMGGHGQAQTHLQLLARMVDDGEDVQRAIAAPRWLVDPADGAVRAERRVGEAVLEGLGRRGHAVTAGADHEYVMGHAHAIRVDPAGYAGATDPRAEGAVLGL